MIGTFRSRLFATLFAPLVLLSPLTARGANDEPDAESKIQEALAELPAADRKLAEAQRYCAVMSKNRLGSMGKPEKLKVGKEAVFVCCDGCTKKALANPKATLETVKKLKKVAASLAKLSAEDRSAAEAQRFCAIQNGHLLGSMGPPIKLSIKNQPVFLCCKGCQQAALRNPDATLDKVKELQNAEE